MRCLSEGTPQWTSKTYFSASFCASSWRCSSRLLFWWSWVTAGSAEEGTLVGAPVTGEPVGGVWVGADIVFMCVFEVLGILCLWFVVMWWWWIGICGCSSGGARGGGRENVKSF